MLVRQKQKQKSKTKKAETKKQNKKAKTKKQKHQRWRNRWLTAIITSLFFKEFRNVFYYFQDAPTSRLRSSFREEQIKKLFRYQ